MELALPASKVPEFHSLDISVSHEFSGGHYQLSLRQNIGAQARYRVILGDSRLYISASTALPARLFRYGADADEGSVALSAGATVRMVWLGREGEAFPVGLELGILGTGIENDPQLSFVTGLGFGIPVLNARTSLETRFNIHAWLELSPTRTGPGSSPWSFLFGPSFTVGSFGTTL